MKKAQLKETAAAVIGLAGLFLMFAVADKFLVLLATKVAAVALLALRPK